MSDTSINGSVHVLNVKSVDEANLSLGRADILTQNTAEALKAFELVKSPEYAQLAQLWSIYAGQQ